MNGQIGDGWAYFRIRHGSHDLGGRFLFSTLDSAIFAGVVVFLALCECVCVCSVPLSVLRCPSSCSVMFVVTALFVIPIPHH